MRGIAPTIDEYCDCAVNEIDKLDQYKNELACTLWPGDNYWRTFSLYERAKQACVPRGKPMKPWFADDLMDIYKITHSEDDAQEGVVNRAVQTSGSPLIVNKDYMAALRFRDLNIEQGANVKGAFMGLQPYANAGDMNNTMVTVSVEKNDNSKVIKPKSGNISNRELAAKKFTIMNVGADINSVDGTRSQNLIWHDVKSQLKYTVMMNRWAPGNAMTLILDYNAGQDLRVYSADSSQGLPPMLLIQIGDAADEPPLQMNSADDDTKGMSGGAVFGIVLICLISVGAIAYGAMYYSNNKTLFTSFRQDAQFEAFQDDEAAKGYAPPESNDL